MKFINYLESITGVDIYPLTSLLIFFLFFSTLTIWVFKADKGDKHIESLVKKKISTILGVIRRKHITHAQAIYIVNAVLLPRLEYKLKTTIWEEK